MTVPDAAVDPDPSEAAHATSAVTPDEVAAVGAIVAGRAPDPDVVAAAYDHSVAALVTTVGGGAAAQAPLTAWREWWRSRTPAESGAWQPSELSYAFSASTSDATLPVHQADRFPGGTLDWYAFDVAPAPGAPPGPAPSLPEPTRSIPAPITFAGAAGDRYWQLDDARVDLGALDTYPTELAKLIVAEFTACFVGDWFRLPASVPYGSAVRVEALVSTDTFGVSTLVPSATAAAGARPWRMYEHSAVSGTADGSWLLVPSAVASRIASAPVEEVVLARDPAADLAWGIEGIVANAVGRPVRRSEDLAAQVRVPAPDPRAGLPGAWVWRLATTVPENWIPFLLTRGRGR